MGRLQDAFGDMRIEDMRIPLYLTATRFDDGAQAIFSKGRVIDAIRASIAVPFLSVRGRSTARSTWTATCPIRCPSASRSRKAPR